MDLVRLYLYVFNQSMICFDLTYFFHSQLVGFCWHKKYPCLPNFIQYQLLLITYVTVYYTLNCSCLNEITFVGGYAPECHILKIL